MIGSLHDRHIHILFLDGRKNKSLLEKQTSVKAKSYLGTLIPYSHYIRRVLLRLKKPHTSNEQLMENP